VLVKEKLPLESNCLVLMLAQLLNGSATLVALNTAKGAFGGPLLPLQTTLAADATILANFGCETVKAITSIEPSRVS